MNRETAIDDVLQTMAQTLATGHDHEQSLHAVPETWAEFKNHLRAKQRQNRHAFVAHYQSSEQTHELS